MGKAHGVICTMIPWAFVTASSEESLGLGTTDRRFLMVKQKRHEDGTVWKAGAQVLHQQEKYKGNLLDLAYFSVLKMISISSCLQTEESLTMERRHCCSEALNGARVQGGRSNSKSEG